MRNFLFTREAKSSSSADPSMVYVRAGRLPAEIHKRFRYCVSLRTVGRWRKKHPLPAPCTLEQLYGWFLARIAEK